MNNKEANFWPVKAIRVHPVGMTPVSVNGSLRELLSLPATPPTRIEAGMDHDGFRNGWNAALRYVRQHPDTILPSIDRLIFNNPATIVYWSDGTKTVVKCQLGDTFNAEIGLMAAMLKRFLGNDNSYNKIINHWLAITPLPAQPKTTEDTLPALQEGTKDHED